VTLTYDLSIESVVISLIDLHRKWSSQLKKILFRRIISAHFFRFVNKRIYRKPTIGFIKTDANVTLYDDFDKAEAFNKYFASVWRLDNGKLPECDYFRGTNLDCVNFDEGEVIAAIKKLKSNFTCGPESLPPVFFKQLKDVLCFPLMLVYKQLICVAYVPDVWKQGYIIPVHKKGPAYVCSNYRPISVTCVSSKILERILYVKILQHLELNNILYREQHGFVKGRSTLTNLLESLNDWTLTIQDKQSVAVIYIDFAKAFDVVSHEKLFRRLYSYGIRGSLLSWLKNFFPIVLIVLKLAQYYLNLLISLVE